MLKNEDWPCHKHTTSMNKTSVTMTTSKYKNSKAGEKTFKVWWERSAFNITWQLMEEVSLQDGEDFIFSKLWFFSGIEPRNKYWLHVYMPDFDETKSLQVFSSFLAASYQVRPQQRRTGPLIIPVWAGLGSKPFFSALCTRVNNHLGIYGSFCLSHRKLSQPMRQF